MSRQPQRQLDIQRVHNQHLTLPLAIPYRLDATDYVFFNYPTEFPADKYQVVVESPSTGSAHPLDRFRSIGHLRQKVELPGVHFSKGFGSAAKIGVVPNNDERLPGFVGNLVRGATYTIAPNALVILSNGLRQLFRTGGVL